MPFASFHWMVCLCSSTTLHSTLTYRCLQISSSLKFFNSIHSTLEHTKFADIDPFGSPALCIGPLYRMLLAIKDNKRFVTLCECDAHIRWMQFSICCCCCFHYRIVRCACVLVILVLFRLRCIFAPCKAVSASVRLHACNEPTDTHLQMQSVWFRCNDHWPSDRIWFTKPMRADKSLLLFCRTPYTSVAHAYNLAIVSRIRNSM